MNAFARAARNAALFVASAVGGSYRAIEDDGRRKASTSRSVAEDRVLTQRQRQRLTATTRDCVRNFAVAQWAVEKHLDYVSGFRFRGMTDNEGFNRELEKFIGRVSRPEAFDLAGRHSLATAVRLMEKHATIDGDAAWLKYSRGRAYGRVELVEGDRVRNDGADREQQRRGNWTNGVDVDPRTGRSRRLAIANRTNNGFEPGRIVSARNAIVRGYYTRYDQVRGISPLAASLNALRDVDESFDLARTKLKVSQMIGLIFKQSADGPLGDYLAQQLRQDDEDALKAETEAEVSGEDPPEDPDDGYDVDLSHGQFALNMKRGDDVNMLESKTPAAEVVNFLKLQIHVAIRGLDLPYSFFDESFTNFYGQRGCFLSYLQSAAVKQRALQDVLDAWTRWRVGLAVATGELELPEGMTFEDILWSWVPVGQPWWDPAKEISAYEKAFGLGIDNPQRVCHATGTDYQENIDQLAEAAKYAKGKGVAVTYGSKPEPAEPPNAEAAEAERAEERAKNGDDDD